ncbi:putative Cytochrome oxidase biogenesis protein Sco1/SenC/PrrC, copper metallochaperone [Rubrivivax sp. A210]|uniref:SCO family protein n=1 Tax=Rubrivivax sp. A210 TaxID=2772301 RepID=UPI0019A8BAB1|nr:SCO family protein [Rubrivivax sp. A210]CAD5373335.1 putative Cytochrome oxidase biogenesis protein Sco1/SenC/PrrC, copper metallochaperone [Rubrivivax sp. A210]
MKTTISRPARLALVTALLLTGGMSGAAWAMDHSAHAGHAGHAAQDPHAGHAAHAAASTAVRRSEATLEPAAVNMLSQDGQRLDFAKLLDDGRPVVLNFIYTSCTAICPVTSQVFRETRELLGRDRNAVRMVSVSIDPDHDTPKRLAAYAQRFGQAGTWTFLTGSQADSVAIQKSFKAYQGDKMNHLPVTFLRAAPGKPWVRLDGFASPNALAAEVQAMLAARPAAARRTATTVARAQP